MPKALRPFFRHDRRLFCEVSRLIYDIVGEFYHEAAGRSLLTGIVVAHQTFGDMLRWNPHFHAGCRAEQQSVRIATRPIVLEGGFDDQGTIVYIPFSGLQSMVEVFRRRVIKLLVEQGLLKISLHETSCLGGIPVSVSITAFASSTSPRSKAWRSTSHGRPGCMREQFAERTTSGSR